MIKQISAKPLKGGRKAIGTLTCQPVADDRDKWAQRRWISAEFFGERVMSRKMNSKRVLGLVMTIAMVLSSSPGSSFALDGDLSLEIGEEEIVDDPIIIPERGLQESSDNDADNTGTTGSLFESILTVSWNAGEGEISSDYSDDPSMLTEEYAEGENIRPFTEMALVAPENMIFKGWTTDGTKEGIIDFEDYWVEGEDGSYYDYPVDSDLSFTALWEGVFTVSWNAGEGEISSDYSDDPSMLTEEYAEGENIRPFTEMALVAPENKAFLGWSIGGTKDGIVDFEKYWIENDEGGYYDYPVNGDLSFTAVWGEVFTVTWNAGGGEISKEYSDDPFEFVEKYAEGENIRPFPEQNLISPENMVFKGWSTDGTTEGIIDFEDYWVVSEEGCYYDFPLGDDMVFYSVWRSKDSHINGESVEHDDVILCATEDSGNAGIELNAENFPDSDFRAYLRRRFNVSQYINEEQVRSVTSINVEDLDIFSLKGIELFPNLTYLDCDYTKIRELDLSRCYKLESLYCSSCNLEQLQICGCSSLSSVECRNNKLSSLDASGCTSLSLLECDDNKLESICLSDCVSLSSLYCSKNQLNCLDIRDCTYLVLAYIYRMDYTPIDGRECYKYFVRHPSMSDLYIEYHTLYVDSFVKILATDEDMIVTYDPNGGAFSSGLTFCKDEVLHIGEPFGPLPELVERDGYVFLGWYTEDVFGTRINSNTLVNKNYSRIVARWRELPFEIVSGKFNSKKKEAFRAIFDPEYFFSYNGSGHGQDGLLMLSALAAYSTYAGGKDTKTISPQSFMKECRFEEDSIKEMFSKDGKEGSHSNIIDNDHGTMYIGSRVVSDGDTGEKKTLIAVFVSGYSEGAYEWISNFNVGTNGTYHTGFKKAADEITSRIKSYAQNYSNGLEVVYWITGHSRGGALTNIIAVNLLNEGNQVDAYGFATPRYYFGTTSSYYNDSIINIISPDDFVPQVAPQKWGFGRFGRNFEFNELYRYAMMDEYEDEIGSEYAGNDSFSMALMIKNFVLISPGRDDYYSRGYLAGGVHLKTGILGQSYLRYPYQYCQQGISYVMINNNTVKSLGVVNMLSFFAYGPAFAYMNAQFIKKGARSDGINDAHLMEAYVSWLLSGVDEESSLLQNEEAQ